MLIGGALLIYLEFNTPHMQFPARWAASSYARGLRPRSAAHPLVRRAPVLAAVAPSSWKTKSAAAADPRYTPACFCLTLGMLTLRRCAGARVGRRIPGSPSASAPASVSWPFLPVAPGHPRAPHQIAPRHQMPSFGAAARAWKSSVERDLVEGKCRRAVAADQCSAGASIRIVGHRSVSARVPESRVPLSQSGITPAKALSRRPKNAQPSEVPGP